MASKSKRSGKNGGGRKAKSMVAGGGGEQRDLTLKDEGQEYGTISKALGGCRFQVKCFDGKERICKVRGKHKGGRGGNYYNEKDIILIGIRAFSDKTADIIQKYTASDARRLKAQGELPDNTVVVDDDKLKIEAEAACAFDFEEI